VSSQLIELHVSVIKDRTASSAGGFRDGQNAFSQNRKATLMLKLTSDHLAELETMRAQLDAMSKRIRDLFFQLASDDDHDPDFVVAARLSRVDSGFDVMDSLMSDATAAVASALAGPNRIDNVLRLHHKLTGHKN
jgi:hypothetical protein